MSDNDHGGRESASSKVRFHTQGKESKGSYASSSRSGGKSYVYEEEGESERSQQWGPQIGGKCERDFIGYSNSYQNVRHLTHTLLPHTTNQIIKASDT